MRSRRAGACGSDPGRGQIRAWETANRPELTRIRYYYAVFRALSLRCREAGRWGGGGCSPGGAESLGNLWLFGDVFSSRKPERTDEQSTPAGPSGRTVRIRVRPGIDKNGENFWNWRLTCNGQFLQFARPAIVGSVPRCGSQGRWRGLRQHGRRPTFWEWRVSEANKVPNSRRVGGSKRARHSGGSPTGDGVKTIPLSSLFQCDRESAIPVCAANGAVAGRAWFFCFVKTCL